MIDDEFWQKYSEYYDKFTPKHQVKLLEYVSSRLSGSVLDMGMGVGKLLPFASNALEVIGYTGIEQNARMFERAQEKANLIERFEPSLYLSNVSNLDDLNLNKDEFDSMVFLNVLYSNDSPIEILDLVKKRIKRNGYLILSEPARKIYPERLLEAMNLEFGNNPDYLEYVDMNKQLVGKAVTYNIGEMDYFLRKLGFKVIESSNEYFLGSNITFLARNVKN